MKNSTKLLIAGAVLAGATAIYFGYRFLMMQRAYKRDVTMQGANQTISEAVKKLKSDEIIPDEATQNANIPKGTENTDTLENTEKLSYWDYEKDMPIFPNEARQPIFDMEKELAEFERTSNLGDR
jgi:hypothetical protein